MRSLQPELCTQVFKQLIKRDCCFRRPFLKGGRIYFIFREGGTNRFMHDL